MIGARSEIHKNNTVRPMRPAKSSPPNTVPSDGLTRQVPQLKAPDGIPKRDSSTEPLFSTRDFRAAASTGQGPVIAAPIQPATHGNLRPHSSTVRRELI